MDSDLSIVIVGHVDHGKSTLVGRLLHETGSLPDGKVETTRKACEARGVPFEWAYIMDSLKLERDQGITIDIARINFATKKRRYTLLDAPGHLEFLRNMITGASSADSALLIVDADEGIKEQTRQHCYLLHLLGVNHIVIAINKLDKVDYNETRYNSLRKELCEYLVSVGFALDNTTIIPVSAKEGANITVPSEKMNWYQGDTVLSAIEALPIPLPDVEKSLRMFVQDVYKHNDKRIIAGQIESGSLSVGEEVMFSPSGRSAVVETIESWSYDGDKQNASAGESIGITLDNQLFVERGAVLSHKVNPTNITNKVKAKLFWLDNTPLYKDDKCILRVGTAKHNVTVEAIDKIIDANDLALDESGETVDKNSMAEIVLHSKSFMALDENARFALQKEEGYISGGGIITYLYNINKAVKSTNITKVEHQISLEERKILNGHDSGIIWFTGLSGAGKSTLAINLEKMLFHKGYNVYVLDGDNVRYGLCSDLGFSAEDRTENIRRVGEVAGLFARAGFIVITAFISPYCRDRDIIREKQGDIFHEIYIKADVSTCEERDPKGLYKKARSGEIEKFTGISDAYEAPVNPELIVDTAENNVDECLDVLMEYIADNFSLQAHKQAS